jgi:hypothetical protein
MSCTGRPPPGCLAAPLSPGPLARRPYLSRGAARRAGWRAVHLSPGPSSPGPAPSAPAPHLARQLLDADGQAAGPVLEVPGVVHVQREVLASAYRAGGLRLEVAAAAAASGRFGAGSPQARPRHGSLLAAVSTGAAGAAVHASCSLREGRSGRERRCCAGAGSASRGRSARASGGSRRRCRAAVPAAGTDCGPHVVIFVWSAYDIFPLLFQVLRQLCAPLLLLLLLFMLFLARHGCCTLNAVGKEYLALSAGPRDEACKSRRGPWVCGGG